MTESDSWGAGLTRRQRNDPGDATTEASSWGGKITRAQWANPNGTSEAEAWGGPLTLAQALNPATVLDASSWGGGLTLRQLVSVGPATEADSWGGFITRAQLQSSGGGLRAAILAGASAGTLNYINRVETSDGQDLENGVLAALVTFANWRIPLGGACCVLAGARTLAGALQPLVGPAPTGVNLVAGDYNRRRILLNGTNKSIITNTTFTSWHQNNRHTYVRLASNFTKPAGLSFIFGGYNLAGHDSLVSTNNTQWRLILASSAPVTLTGAPTVSGAGGYGLFRNAADEIQYVIGSLSGLVTDASTAPVPAATLRIGSNMDGVALSAIQPNAYSSGPHIDMAEISGRTAALESTLAAALP